MTRKTLVTLHMYLSAFFAPFIIMVSVSGGLYLLGIKGEVVQESIYSGAGEVELQSPALKSQVEQVLVGAGVSEYSFEYVKVSGSTLYTRPTTRDHYVIKLGEGTVEVLSAEPSLQSALIELHKGHGPGLFKTFQKIFALGLLLIIVSGLWLGLSAVGLRRRTLLTSAAGTAVFLLLAL